MKFRTIIAALFLIVTITTSLFAADQTSAPLTPAVKSLKNLAPVDNWENRIKTDTVKIADGIQFRLKDYVRDTSFKNRASLKPVFDANFEKRLLKRPVQYTEDVQEMGDRLIVKRTMLLDAKNPCDREIEKAGISICFKPTGKAIKPETKKYLDQVRLKIKQRISDNPNDSESIRVKPYLKMSDAKLLDQLLNKEQTTKIITHHSVIPFIAYEFRKVPEMDVFDLKTPLSRNHQLTSVKHAAVVSQATQHTDTATGTTAGGATSGAPAPGPYTFPNTSEITAKVLTGWTIGKTFGDYFEVEFADSTWLTDRYYAGFRYNISAGFGLRWPFEIKATSTIDKVYGKTNDRILSYPANEICSGSFSTSGENAKTNAYYCAQRATVKVQAKAVNGDSAFYRATGLPSDKVFDGKEFVFEIGATCKFTASIPGPNINISCPSSLKGFDFGRDFTPQLGSTPLTLFNYTIPGRPLGLALEMYIGYAALNPGVSLTAHSGSLTADVKGYQATPSKNSVTFSTTAASFTVAEKNARGNWGIQLSDPEYGVNAALVPSLQIQVGIDLGVYAWNKKFGPYNIDALGIELGRATFPTHQDTNDTFDMKKIGTRPSR
jgi:hypothetical protein